MTSRCKLSKIFISNGLEGPQHCRVQQSVSNELYKKELSIGKWIIDQVLGAQKINFLDSATYPLDKSQSI